MAPLGPRFDDALQKNGGTFAVAVNPGQYTLQRWVIQKGERVSMPPDSIGIPFVAEAGQVTYLGNFDFDGDGKVALRDRAERDLPVLRSRVPAIGASAPAYAIRAGAEVLDIGGGTAPSQGLGLEVARNDGARETRAERGAPPPAPTSKPTRYAFDPTTMASVQDGVANVDYKPRGTRFFVVAEVDGMAVARDAQSTSIGASRGMGMNMRVVDVERPVPAGRTRLKLRGALGFAAPIQFIFAAIASDGSREMSGEVEVALKPDGRYRVDGVIDELRSEVWLEDVVTHEVVAGSRVAGATTPEGAKAAAAPRTYACCNLHYDEDRWISDGNWIERPFLPAGTPLQIYEYRKDRVKALVDGRVTWLGLDNGGKQQTLADWVARLAVKDDPSPRIAAYPARVQAAIQAGKVVPGMTKEQVVVALGHPRTDLNPSLAAPRWAYVTEADATFFLVWTDDDRLQAVEGAPEVRGRVLGD